VCVSCRFEAAIAKVCNTTIATTTTTATGTKTTSNPYLKPMSDLCYGGPSLERIVTILSCDGVLTDIDECDMFNNLCVNGDCENTMGYFQCTCAPGYKLDATAGNCTGNVLVSVSTCPSLCLSVIWQTKTEWRCGNTMDTFIVRLANTPLHDEAGSTIKLAFELANLVVLNGVILRTFTKLARRAYWLDKRSSCTRRVHRASFIV